MNRFVPANAVTALRAAFAALGIACMLAAPAAAQYSGTDINDDLTAAARQALSQDALQSHQGGGGGGGPEVDLRIVFPSQQTGLSNIEMTMLEPRDAGAHQCEAIAVKSGGNVISASFIPKKDVRPGHVYDVVVSDSMGDEFAVGRIRVGAGSPQAYRIDAPLLTPGSPRYTPPPISASGASDASASTDQAPPAQGQTADRHAFERAVLAQAAPAPLLGLKGATVTPQLLALAGSTSSSFHGIVVSQVNKGSLAEEAGIRSGDVIVTADGKPCPSIQQLVAVTQDENGPAKAIDIALVRDEQNGPKVIHTKVPSERLVVLVGTLDKESAPIPTLQMRGDTITPALLAIGDSRHKSLRGVVVFKVDDGGLAQRAGLDSGDIIVAVDGQPCATVRQLLAMTRQYGAHGQPINLTVERHDAKGNLHTRHLELALTPTPK